MNADAAQPAIRTLNRSRTKVSRSGILVGTNYARAPSQRLLVALAARGLACRPTSCDSP